MHARALLPVVLLAGCGTRAATPTLSVPNPSPGRVEVAAEAVAPLGEVQPIAVAVTSARAEALHLDARQIFAHAGAVTDPRVAPLPAAEAARRAGGHRLPGAVRAGAVGAATGGALGAVGGAIAGAIQGGIGGAVAVGSAVGASLGAITGVLGGSHESPDVAGFTDRALPDTTLRSGLSATGYVYFPAGTYRTLELLLTDELGSVVVSSVVAVESGR